LPAPFLGSGQEKEDLVRWSSGMLFKYDETGIAQRAARSNSWRNQSIWGVSNRMLRRVEPDPRHRPHVPVYSNFADLKFSTVNLIILSAALLFGVAFIAVMPNRSRRSAETDALEFALLLLLMLIFTPLTFGYLVAWLLYPFTVIVERLLSFGSRRLLIFAAIATALLALTIPFRIGAQTYGNTFAAAVILFVALAWELCDVKRRSGAPDQFRVSSAAAGLAS
jgi:hypothetical protein